MDDSDFISKPIHIASMFSGYKFEVKKARRSQRSDLINSFLEELNPPRIRIQLKPIKPAHLNWMFKERKMDNDQIYCFFQDCKRNKNFSSYFWWSLKVQPKQSI